MTRARDGGQPSFPAGDASIVTQPARPVKGRTKRGHTNPVYAGVLDKSYRNIMRTRLAAGAAVPYSQKSGEMLMRKLFRFRKSGTGVQARHDCFAVSSEVRACQHAEGIVLLNLGKGTVFTSNRAGSAIWTGLSNQESVPMIAARLAREFGIDEQQASEDTIGFCRQLEAQGFLTQGAA
jgi:hypothetical protein